MASATRERTVTVERPVWQHPRVIACAALVAVAMVPVSVVLAALGIFVLELAGGAATDTSLVVTITAVLVTDFWAGGIIRALTRIPARDIAIIWGIARAIVLILAALLIHRLALVAPLQLLLAVPVAYVGAIAAARQSQLKKSFQQAEKRAIERDARRRGNRIPSA
jgi:hypothetical protein